MKGKTFIVFAVIVLSSVKVFSQSMTLDEAIKTTALELEQRIKNSVPDISFGDKSIEETAPEIRRQLTGQTKIAVLNFSSAWKELSDYVIDELNIAIVRNGSLTVVERQQLDLLGQEREFQMSGDVDDKSAQSIGKLSGAQSVLSGSFTIIGNSYRFRIRVIGVETGELQHANSIDIKRDSILTALTPEPKKEPAPPIVKPAPPPKPIIPKPPREPLEVEPIININLADLGGGDTLGFEWEFGLQAGASVERFIFLIDASIGWGVHNTVKGSFHLGGIAGVQFLDLFLLGLGGGYAGMAEAVDDNPDFSYPYLQGSISFIIGVFDLGVYYDYNFDYGSKLGLRWHWKVYPEK